MKRTTWLVMAFGVGLLAAGCGRLDGIADASAPAPTGVAASTTQGAADMTPTHATDQPGQTAPGAATDGATEPTERATPAADGATQTFRDEGLGFQVDYPADWAARERDAAQLEALEPHPTAAVVFMNPVALGSDNPDLEPADLEIRVYARGDAPSLDAWLTVNGLVPADGSSPARPLEKAHVSGLEVCGGTMIAPGCAFFVAGDATIFQLIPATIAGETMLDSFMLLP